MMMENRSFDSVLGWLYEDSNNRPPLNIPEKAQPTFDGLLPRTFSNMHAGQQIFASHPPTPWPPKYNANLVPDPDEEFDHITNQLFWNSVSGPRSSCKYEWFFCPTMPTSKRHLHRSCSPTKVASAQARHPISDFILRITIFRAEHTDRLAKLESGADLTDGDRLFQYCDACGNCRFVWQLMAPHVHFDSRNTSNQSLQTCG
jgi:hypothetical protein